ncbi:SF-assemblin beta giardin family protein [Cryptosporidium andersoni]|uniref:SF-assemblin beta giardin family protein n=1 Tax=Cryptosporidium andersoni TaxID=117008 RepID=A0A1J4MTS1_9CRYT|nr:SF-assemblin beta giardin family protein [Cryptosporidium andersoni]
MSQENSSEQLNRSELITPLSQRPLELSMGLRNENSDTSINSGTKAEDEHDLLGNRMGSLESCTHIPNFSNVHNFQLSLSNSSLRNVNPTQTMLSSSYTPDNISSSLSVSPTSFIPNSSSLPLSTKQKLSQIQGQLLGLEKQLRNDTRQKREYEETRFQNLKENTLKLRKSLDMEIQQRNEIHNTLKKSFEQQISSVQEKLENIFLGKLDQLSIACQSLQDRLQVIEKEIGEDKTQIFQDYENRYQALKNEVINAKSIAEREYHIAEDKEKQIRRFLKDLEVHVKKEVEREHTQRETIIQTIQDDFYQLRDKIEKNQDKFQNFVLEEVAHLKNGLAKETQNRESADDDIVQALNQYTKALQDVLKIIC